MLLREKEKRIDEIIEGYKAGPFYVKLPNGAQVHEWTAFKMAKKEKIKLQMDRFGSTGKNNHVVERGLTDMPSTLYTIFKRQLTSEEWDWFDSPRGKLWIAKKYPVLRFGEQV